MRLLLISLLAFAAGLAVWIARGDDTPAAPRPERPVLTGTSGDIPKLQRAVREGRDDLRPSLANAYLQRVRETADPSFYAKAEGVLGTPRTPEGLATAGELALARHDFRGALAIGQRAGAIGAPVRVDALVELGRYDEAARELQAMLDRRPNLAGYARASYLRELRGDLAGAVEAMRLAVGAGGPAPENAAYVGALLGELERRRGRDAAAKRAFEQALALVPGHPGAEAGLARLEGGRRAIARLQRGSSSGCRCPSTRSRSAKRELAAGRERGPTRLRWSPPSSSCWTRPASTPTSSWRSSRPTTAIRSVPSSSHVAAGTRRRAHAPPTRSAGRSPAPATHEAGLRWSRRALKLGSVDPIWRAHAGLAALEAGRRAEGRRHLRVALRHGLDGWPWQAQRVRRALHA